MTTPVPRDPSKLAQDGDGLGRSEVVDQQRTVADVECAVLERERSGVALDDVDERLRRGLIARHDQHVGIAVERRRRPSVAREGDRDVAATGAGVEDAGIRPFAKQPPDSVDARGRAAGKAVEAGQVGEVALDLGHRQATAVEELGAHRPAGRAAGSVERGGGRSARIGSIHGVTTIRMIGAGRLLFGYGRGDGWARVSRASRVTLGSR